MGSAAVLALVFAGVWLVRDPRPTAAGRGAVLYRELGCAGCHGGAGVGGVPNPGSKEREVPGFTGGTAMMYVESEEEIREWILDGRPARLQEPLAGEEALLTMPAYRGHIDEQQLDALVAWYKAAAWYEPDMPPDVERGRQAARRAGCFGCHGASGRAGARNPGSFKGYIPGWGSADYFELVESDAELREWILDGRPQRLAQHPAARWFMDRQIVTMPAYRETLSDEELEGILTYIRWVAQRSPKPE